jgi:hypothetical protein
MTTWNIYIPRLPPQLEKIWFFGVKSWFFTRNTQIFSRLPPLGAIFFKYDPPNLKSFLTLRGYTSIQTFVFFIGFCTSNDKLSFCSTKTYRSLRVLTECRPQCGTVFTFTSTNSYVINTVIKQPYSEKNAEICNDLYVFVEQNDSLSLLVQNPIKKTNVWILV